MSAQLTEADVEPVTLISQTNCHANEKHDSNYEGSLNRSAKFDENTISRHIYDSSDQDSCENLLNSPNQDMIQYFCGFTITRVKKST